MCAEMYMMKSILRQHGLLGEGCVQVAGETLQQAMFVSLSPSVLSTVLDSFANINASNRGARVAAELRADMTMCFNALHEHGLLTQAALTMSQAPHEPMFVSPAPSPLSIFGETSANFNALSGNALALNMATIPGTNGDLVIAAEQGKKQPMLVSLTPGLLPTLLGAFANVNQCISWRRKLD